jgi:DUF4097 and DUF4098 domain-containing protein YvlB
MKRAAIILVATATFIGAPLQAQNANPDRLTVTWSDPGRPGLLKVNLLNGSLSVKAHTGRDVIIEAKAGTPRGRDRRPPARDGLRRIDATATGLRVEEQNNVMTVGTSAFNSSSELEIQVPARTNLNLHVVNGGDLAVDGIEGEIEVQNTNGNVRVTNVAGLVVAHSSNGNVLVSLRQVTANKPMAYTSLNGNIDVTLPASSKANLKMRSDNGEIYSDFEIQLRPSDSKPTLEDTRKQGGRYRIETERSVTGTINGGGAEFDFRTLNGNIFIRKGN